MMEGVGGQLNQNEASPYHYRLLQQDVIGTSLENTPTPSEGSPQPHSHEQSPHPDKGHIREWYNGYKPAKRRKKAPRPGESTFRVPMSMEQRKSLGASVRPRETETMNTTQPAQDTPSVAQNPVVPATRGGTKLKFRAYGPPAVQTPSRRNTSDQVSPISAVSQSDAANYFQQPSSLHNQLHFSTAPLENGPKLAWWVAQQLLRISHHKQALSPRVAELAPSQFYGRDEVTGDRKRESDRERKARWRGANAERSKFTTARMNNDLIAADRENDLRARVNRDARLKFGESDSPTKSDWILGEIMRRKNRTQDKEISRASKSGHFPIFPNAEAVRNSLLRESVIYSLPQDIQRVRQLIVDVLFPTSDAADYSHRYQSVQVLSETISKRYPQEEEILRAAFTGIASEELAYNAVKSTLEPFSSLEDEEHDYDSYTMNPGQSNTPADPRHIINTLNNALSILRGLKEIGDKHETVLAKIAKASDAPRRLSQREHRQHLKDNGMSESQLEDFLLLVNGGPLESDPDDDLAVELYGNDLDIEVPPPAGPPKPTNKSDPDVWTAINSVVETILKRAVLPPKRGRRAKHVVEEEEQAKQSAEQVKTLLKEIGIGANRVRSRLESQAIAEFYNRLTNFEDTTSFGKDIPLPPSLDTSGNGEVDQNIAHRQIFHDGNHSTIHSPAAAPLPDATNPFAADELEAPQSTHRPTLPPPIRSPQTTESHQQSAGIDRMSPLVPLAPLEPRIQTFSGYPQFRPVDSQGSFRS